MTKLMEWLLIGSLILGSWLAVITDKATLPTDFQWFGRWFPVVFLLFFGLYAIVIVFYRVFTFNNCEAAAIELQKQIKEARADLKSKGINLRTNK